MNPQGPYVGIATLCENVLQEPTNRLSLIRVFDRYDVQFPAETVTGSAAQLPIYVVIAFKSNGFVGKKTLTLKMVSPDGKSAPNNPQAELTFEGGEHGTQSIFKIDMVVNKDGLYWFDVLLDQELMTRIPLRVVFSRPQSQTQPDPGSANG